MLRKVRDYKRLAATNHLAPRRRNEHRDRAEEVKRQGKQCANRRSLEERGRDLVEPSQVLKNFLSRSPLARLLQTEEDTIKHLRVLQRYSEDKNKPVKVLKKGKSFTTMPLIQGEGAQAVKVRNVTTFHGIKRLGPQSAPAPPKKPPRPKEPESPKIVPVPANAPKSSSFKKENYMEALANSYRKVFSARPDELTPTKTRMKRSKSASEIRRTPSTQRTDPKDQDPKARAKSDYILEALVKEKLIGRDISSKPVPLFTKRGLVKSEKKPEKAVPKMKKETTGTKDVFKERIQNSVDIAGKTTYQLLSEYSRESKESSAIPIVKEKIQDVVMDPRKTQKSEKIWQDAFVGGNKSTNKNLVANQTGKDVGEGKHAVTTLKEKPKSTDSSIKTSNDYLSSKTVESELQPKKSSEREKFDIEVAIQEAKNVLGKESDSAQCVTSGTLKANAPPWKEYVSSDLVTSMSGSSTSLGSSYTSDSSGRKASSTDLQRKSVGNKKERGYRVWHPPKEIDDPDMAIGGKKFQGNVEKYFHNKNGGAIKLQEALKKKRLSTQPKKVEKEELLPQIYPKTSLMQKATSLPLQLCHKMMQKQEITPKSAIETQDKKTDEEILPGLVFTVEDKTVKDENSGFFERLTKWFTK